MQRSRRTRLLTAVVSALLLPLVLSSCRDDGAPAPAATGAEPTVEARVQPDAVHRPRRTQHARTQTPETTPNGSSGCPGPSPTHPSSPTP